ncbi:MAG TPA: alpha/beta hydrolase [Opitutales bacterium]|nr:alpha/beta hydrolase [Opitutales bacterium]
MTLANFARVGLTKDIEYAKPGGVSVKLDACIPDGPGPFPAAILVHGGGWSGGDKATEIDPLFAPLTQAGIAWFSINYRLAPQYPYPACVEDAEAAVRWVKAHAKEYNIDPNKIVLIGESAGGHIVDMVAVRATRDKPGTRVAAVVAFYAPCDNVSDTLRRGGPSPSMQKLLGLPPEKIGADGKLSPKTEQALYDISPINFVHKDLPPYLLVHGTADQSVPYEQSVRWQAKLQALGVPCDLVTIKGGPHVMGRWETIDPTYKAQTIAWLVKTLGMKKPETPAPAAPTAKTTK